jgi:hypothetical protein
MIRSHHILRCKFRNVPRGAALGEEERGYSCSSDSGRPWAMVLKNLSRREPANPLLHPLLDLGVDISTHQGLPSLSSLS